MHEGEEADVGVLADEDVAFVEGDGVDRVRRDEDDAAGRFAGLGDRSANFSVDRRGRVRDRRFFDIARQDAVVVDDVGGSVGPDGCFEVSFQIVV